MKMKKHELKQKPADDTESSPPADNTPVASKNVTCSYGIHRGNFPIAGMKVKDARRVLRKLIKVDDSAAAVINGSVVDEDETISSETTMLSFVKPSAVKGAGETITLSDKTVEGVGKKMNVAKFCDLISSVVATGLSPEPIPDNVKWIVRAGKLEVLIVELKPELRRIQWIAENGVKPDMTTSNGQGYTFRKLATPYVVMSVPFWDGQLHPALELFYRNEPLTSLDDPLYTCNLLNVSMGKLLDKNVGLKTWVCTQFLELPKKASRADILSEIISHVFGGGFNRSSDHNEGASGFSTYEKAFKGGNPSCKIVSDVNAWEKASEKDPYFTLDVDWLKAGCTPRDLIDFRLKQFKVDKGPTTSTAIGNLLLGVKEEVQF